VELKLILEEKEREIVDLTGALTEKKGQITELKQYREE
jgi:hypothetical protein